jgi:hypothetical protein
LSRGIISLNTTPLFGQSGKLRIMLFRSIAEGKYSLAEICYCLDCE